MSQHHEKYNFQTTFQNNLRDSFEKEEIHWDGKVPADSVGLIPECDICAVIIEAVQANNKLIGPFSLRNYIIPLFSAIKYDAEAT